MRGLPLFPLPDFYLFPGAVAPLHVFEPKYRQMVGDLLDTAARLVLAAYRPGGPRTGSGPVVLPVGGLGEIVHHETLADGRYLIWVLGLGRVEMQEVASDRLYRKADARLIHDHEPDRDAERALVPQLFEAIQSRAPRGHQLEGDLPLGLLADILLNTLPLDAERTAAVFADRCPVRRAERALAWHEEH
ncbi:MAG TPA: LON peptidase substrate-binding domain-containing protein [Candidatus Krumholzibacteria bacterium]|nr:LON peptidase substrate-binding domain-containing protein [Candidatus Krumholzibacteria bacterium]HPD72907.1 LON peptidase substrate-binding domain-containing protein [Candidatus Krumholzibacteria bacterium]HRY41706.1 LON peptidase substrate-binding domain-containing protein [Candidatus Krumholzibacteria bacterium]